MALVKTIDDGEEQFVDELKPGTRLLHGQYTIERFINAGGFGITYLARNSLDREVVIKECFPGSFCRRSHNIVAARSRAHETQFAHIVRLFVQEAKSLSRLVHPNIVGVHQVFEENDTAYMAIDYVEGRDLLDIIETDPASLTPALIVQILRKLLGAIAFIHDNGMLHRDISPDNILLSSAGEPVLIDFGAARQQATKVGGKALSALRVVKDGYSPQEFYVAGSQQNGSSDLYALAATFHHIITGEVPPSSQTRLVAIAEGNEDPYLPMAGRIPGYPPGFLEALDQALSVLPKDRIPTAHEWLDRFARRPELKVVSMNDAAGAGQGSRAEPTGLAEGGLQPELAGADRSDHAAAESSLSTEAKVKGLKMGIVGALVIGAGLAVASLLSPPPEAAAPQDDADRASAGGPAVAPAAQTAPPATPTAAPAPQGPRREAAGPAVAPENTPAPAATTTAAAAPVPALEPEAEMPAVPAPRAEAASAAGTGRTIAAAGAVVVPQPAPAPTADGGTGAPVAAPAEAAVPEPPAPEADRGGLSTVPAATLTQASAAAPAGAPEVTVPVAGRSFSDPAAWAAAQTRAGQGIPLPASADVAAPRDPTVLPQQVAATLWKIDLPFRTEPSAVGGSFPRIVEVLPSAAAAPENEWIAKGVILYAVKGDWVRDESSILALLGAGQAFDGSPRAFAGARIKRTEAGAFEEVTLAAPIVREVTLMNGVRARALPEGDAWRTEVYVVPATLEGGLSAGDILVSEDGTGTVLDGPETLESLIAALARNGVPEARFTVERGGNVTEAAMPLTRSR
jgi:serine/threonine protein kinase